MRLDFFRIACIVWALTWIIVAVATYARAADLVIPKPRRPQVTVIGPLQLPGPVAIGKHAIRKNEDSEPNDRHVGMP